MKGAADAVGPAWSLIHRRGIRQCASSYRDRNPNLSIECSETALNRGGGLPSRQTRFALTRTGTQRDVNAGPVSHERQTYRCVEVFTPNTPGALENQTLTVRIAGWVKM
jgi:hypothetical protein